MARSQPAARAAGAADRTDGATVAGVRLSHPDKVLYADQGLTKRDLAAYYLRYGERILPHIADRPLSLVRCPAGTGRPCFFQRHAGAGVAEAVRRLPIGAAEGAGDHLAVGDLEGVIALVQLGVLEIHPWGSRADDVEKPDRLILDFDPGADVAWRRVVDAAREARQRLRDLGLDSFVKTTGGKGLHVMLPITRRHGWDEAKSFTRALAEAMAQDSPSVYVTTVAKAARHGRILIDYLRNARGASAVAPYSTRARRGAPVAMPLDWGDLDGLEAADRFTVRRLSERPAPPDPWAEARTLRQSITARAWRAVGGRR